METLQLPAVTDLHAELRALLEQVPRGRVTTYGDLAKALGDVAASRWIGAWMLDHPHNAQCSCHRVVRATGDPGLYIAGGSEDKLSRLQEEGVAVRGGRVGLDGAVREFETSSPLHNLTAFQSRVPSRLKLTSRVRKVRRVAGIDVAYRSPTEGVVAWVLLDADSRETIWRHTLTLPVSFPYIPGYLAFRELPLMLQMWNAACAAGREADVVFVDGNGYLHPRRAGIAACFGLLAGVPAIGVGKSLLCGCVNLSGMTAQDRRPVMQTDELIGFALKSKDVSKPVYVSPGNLIDFHSAADLARRWMTSHRLPEPLHLADRLSKQTARDAADG